MALPRKKRRSRKGLRWKHPIVIARFEAGPSLWVPLAAANVVGWTRRRTGWNDVFVGRLVRLVARGPWTRRRG